MFPSKAEIVKQSFANLKQKISESPAEKARLAVHLENLEEAIELILDDNRRLETCWSKMTSKLIDIKNRMVKTSKEEIYSLDALISISGLKITIPNSNLAHYDKWIIVKHADFTIWSKYFYRNPATGCEQSFSCAGTVKGKQNNIKGYYTDKNEALKDLLVINRKDPNGKYAVCPMLEPVRSRKDFYKGWSMKNNK